MKNICFIIIFIQRAEMMIRCPVLKQADALHKTIKGKLLIQVSEDTLVS
jgi:hypothetical protein